MTQIVLIEDDREIATTLQSVLEAAGYGVAHAFNGMEGKRLINQHQPALVITDMMMPKLGGFPVLEYVKTLDRQPKVIMITANEGGRHKAYAEMLGAADYLRKPFTMDVLLATVSGAIGEPETDSTTDSTDRAESAGDDAATASDDAAPLRSRLSKKRPSE